jgi:hypothetical protein
VLEIVVTVRHMAEITETACRRDQHPEIVSSQNEKAA